MKILNVKLRVTKYRHVGNYRLRGEKSKRRGSKNMNECVKVDMKRIGLVEDDVHNREK